MKDCISRSVLHVVNALKITLRWQILDQITETGDYQEYLCIIIIHDKMVLSSCGRGRCFDAQADTSIEEDHLGKIAVDHDEPLPAVPSSAPK